MCAHMMLCYVVVDLWIRGILDDPFLYSAKNVIVLVFIDCKYSFFPLKMVFWLVCKMLAFVEREGYPAQV